MKNDGTQIDSKEVRVTIPNSVDETNALVNLHLAYAGDYLYAVGDIRNLSVLVDGNTVQKDVVEFVIFKINEDGTLTKVKEVPIVITSQNAGNANVFFAKVVGEGDNAKLYIGYKAEGINKAVRVSVANPENPTIE